MPGPLLNNIALATGLLKISVPLNSWILKSKFIAKAQFLIAVPGFALVLYAHMKLHEPVSENIACFLLPAALYVIAFTRKTKTK